MWTQASSPALANKHSFEPVSFMKMAALIVVVAKTDEALRLSSDQGNRTVGDGLRSAEGRSFCFILSLLDVTEMFQNAQN